MTDLIGSISPRDVKTVLTQAFDPTTNTLKVIAVMPSSMVGAVNPRDVQTVLTQVFDSIANALKVTVVGTIVVTSAHVTGDLVVDGSVTVGSVDLAYAAILNIDITQGLVFRLTVTGDCQINATSVVKGQPVIFIITQGGVGNYTVTFGNNFTASGTVIDLVGRTDTLLFIGTDTSWLEVARTVNL